MAPAPSVRRPCARAVAARASRVAEPVSIPVKSPDGADSGSASIALKVADPSTARHVVHRSLLTAHASRRQVRYAHVYRLELYVATLPFRGCSQRDALL